MEFVLGVLAAVLAAVLALLQVGKWIEFYKVAYKRDNHYVILD